MFTQRPVAGAETMAAETPVQAQLVDHQLERLETLLDDPALPNTMRLDEIQGYLCAALSGPLPIPEAAWLADALGGEDAVDCAAGQEAAALLHAFAAALEAELAAGEPPVLLLYAKDGDESGPSDYRPWCQAYLAGVDAASDDWFEFLGEVDYEESGEIGDGQAFETVREDVAFIDERLLPLMVLTGEAEAAALENGEEWPQGEARAQIESDCEEYLPQAVTDIYRFWAARGLSRQSS
ncbi:YecA family protein [Propionivibrio sp.]|uniref:YecA/YgfB family protein n=2 Tax=Propionivibrio sp. TaxID=2212460 RepID=UPI0025DB6FB9|nr:YecA family protein [Propionivibrio sp.]